MKIDMKKAKGFTLIELMIVVAIIGILAAIAIPQFSSYRIKAFNGSAQADLRNIMTSQEAGYAETQSYVNITGVVGSNTALTASIASLPGAKLSKGVTAQSTAGQTTATLATDYSVETKHFQGDKKYTGTASGGIVPSTALPSKNVAGL
ncbi:MAG: prepilin-type N-terminal cleavage/methylation domain-containing protein [Mariprofundaceae bacterium]|nr:prepilin-type N-terminal cleavage/methylation domain-containing protein [Mariprofundaceae bacterium]